jgi:tetratricopeptide (TPR) repeat protein
MMTLNQTIACAASLLITAALSAGGASGAPLRANNPQERVKVFYTEVDGKGWTAVPRGEVVSIGVREDSHKEELLKMARQWSRVTVRLYSPEGVKKGDQLFVVNQRNLIVARVDVQSIFQSSSFGPMLIGYGNYKFTRNGFTVVQKVDDNFSKYAYIYKARGDYFKNNGETGKAIELYRKSLEMDRTYPEAHIALGYIYLKDEVMPFAAKEFSEAYREIDRIYDNEDRYLLLKGLTRTRYRMAYEYTVSGKARKGIISEGIKYAEEALKIYPDSREVNLYLGMFYLKNSEPQDVKAKNQFLKVIQVDPMNAQAYLALAELYRKHENNEKAREYARKALEVRPDSAEARRLLNILQQ